MVTSHLTDLDMFEIPTKDSLDLDLSYPYISFLFSLKISRSSCTRGCQSFIMDIGNFLCMCQKDCQIPSDNSLSDFIWHFFIINLRNKILIWQQIVSRYLTALLTYRKFQPMSYFYIWDLKETSNFLCPADDFTST